MPPSPDTSIVLTGCGWVSPLACGSIGDVLAAARRAEPPPALEHGYRAVAGEVVETYPQLSAELKRDKGAWMTGVAFVIACREAALQIDSLDAERVGMVLGCALAGQLGMISFANEVRQQTPRFVSPIHFPQTVGNYISGALARGFKIRGPNQTLASGAASGLDAIAQGCAELAAGTADVVVAGGADELSKDLAEGLAEPGVVLSEGACLLVLERAESAKGRGIAPMAVVKSQASSKPGAALPAGPDEAIVSCASCHHAGAVFIEHWIGRSFGASGAAAVAAAIGASDGREVPLLEADDRAGVSVRPIAVDRLRAADGSLRAVVRANADGAHATTLELTIPGQARAATGGAAGQSEG